MHGYWVYKSFAGIRVADLAGGIMDVGEGHRGIRRAYLSFVGQKGQLDEKVS